MEIPQKESRGRLAKQRGQAIIEAGLMIPLLVFLLMAVGFLGFAVVENQNVLIAARFAARDASMAAMAKDKIMGSGVLTQSSNTASRLAAAHAVLGSKRGVDAAAPSWSYEGSVGLKKLHAQRIGPLGTAYLAQGTRGGYKFGIGFVMYGNRIGSKAPWLDALGNGTNQGSQLVTGRQAKIWDGAGVKAEAYMPGELPIRSTGNYGLLQMNSWITDILKEPVK